MCAVCIGRYHMEAFVITTKCIFKHRLSTFFLKYLWEHGPICWQWKILHWGPQCIWGRPLSAAAAEIWQGETQTLEWRAGGELVGPDGFVLGMEEEPAVPSPNPPDENNHYLLDSD